MPDLFHSLHKHDIGHLRIIAEFWGLELDSTDVDSAREELSAALLDADLLSEMADWGKDKLGSGVVVLASDIDGKARLVVKVSPDIVKRGAHAGKLVASLAKEVDGDGGGRPDFATAGGKNPKNLDAAISKVDALLADSIQPN